MEKTQWCDAEEMRWRDAEETQWCDVEETRWRDAGKTQCYVGGNPNGVVLCADKASAIGLEGRLYHGYSRRPLRFSSMDQLVFEMEDFFDVLNFPHRTTEERSFLTQETAKGRNRVPKRIENFLEQDHKVQTGWERTRIVSDESLLSRHGDLGTFIIKVQHRQNSSWQGRITWMEKDQTLYFRSIWEMIKLIAGALGTVRDQGEEEEEQTWK